MGVAGAGTYVPQTELKQRVVWRFTGEAVHTQNAARAKWCTQKTFCGHRKSLVILGECKGGPVRPAKRREARGGLAVHRQGGTYTRRCTKKALCGKRKGLVILGGCKGLAPASSKAARSKGWLGGSQARRYIPKAGHTKSVTMLHTISGRWPPQESCYLRGV